MARERMTLAELFRRHGVDPKTLPQAPASPPDSEVRTRITQAPFQPCAACGEDSATVRVRDFGDGPRWVDLCWEHGWATVEPAPRMPTTLEGILADVGEVAAELGLTLRPVSPEELLESARRVMLQRGSRFHLIASADGQPRLHGWSKDEPTARERFTVRVGKSRGLPGARVILIDEAERELLAVWPDPE
ncbi:hypothetical protein [Streptomyces sp. NPDC001137]|uniref:hypothetical protein n=1 Tax=Streptomyces sp. NPDC001137 TaxID=3154378 RepID=UPI0033180CBD